MNERIKQIRLANNLTQEAFADRLFVKRNYVYMIENGKKDVSDRIVRDAAREFSVSEEWIRTGEGDMYKPKNRDEEVVKFLTKCITGEASDFQRKVIDMVAHLSADEWALIEKMAKSVSEEK